MNDSQEDVHGAGVVASLLMKRARARAGAEHRLLIELAQSLEGQPGGRFTYAFSLSENPDVLSQWRGYAPQGGYCIGFFREGIEDVCREQNFLLRRCVYDPAEQTQIASDEMVPLLDSYADWDLDYAAGNHRKAEIARHTERFRPYFKQASFQEESEWRIFGPVSANDSRSRWRTAGPYVRPYVELPFKMSPNPKGNPGPVAEIWVGPGLDFRRAERAIVHLFIGNGMAHIGVHSSASSYRF